MGNKNKYRFSIKKIIANTKMRIKLMSVVISICLFCLISMSAASYVAIKSHVEYSRQTKNILIDNAFQGSSESLLNQARSFLQVISQEQSIICNNTLNELIAEVELLGSAVSDLFENPQFYPLSRPVAAPTDASNGYYINTYALAKGVTMNPQIERELDLLSHLSLLAPSLLNNPNISEVYVAMDSGLLYFYSALRYDNAEYDPRVRPWYIDALNNKGEVIFTDVYDDKFGKGAVLTAAKAIYSDSGEFLGVAAIDIKISNLQERILGTRITDTSYMIIIDDKGKYIVPHNYQGEQPHLTVEKRETSEEYGFYEGLRRMINGEEGFIEGKIGGREIFLIFNPIPSANWSIGVVVYKDDLLQELQELTTRLDDLAVEAEYNILDMINRSNTIFIIIFIVIGFMVALASVKLASIVSKPIQRLATEVMRIGDDDFDYRISVESLDEIGLMAEAYNKMMNNMSKYAQKIVSLNEQNSRLEFAASTDSLTGLLNRGYFMKLYANIVQEGVLESRESFIIMFDLDHFKQINDNYGHSAGDAVLKEAAQRVRYKLDVNDLLGRYGGEEFIIFIHNITESEILRVAERLRVCIYNKPVRYNNINISISASFGIAPVEGNDTESPIVNADEALYKAKNTGRNKVVLYNRYS